MSTGKPDKNRGTVAFFFAIILGYVIGIFIKKVQLGLIIGLAIGLLATGLLRKR